jgi:hypothetical protein
MVSAATKPIPPLSFETPWNSRSVASATRSNNLPTSSTTAVWERLVEAVVDCMMLFPLISKVGGLPDGRTLRTSIGGIVVQSNA